VKVSLRLGLYAYRRVNFDKLELVMSGAKTFIRYILGHLRQWIVGRIVDGEDDISPRTREILLQLDPFTTFFVSNVPQNIIDENADAITQDMVETSEVNLGWKKTGKGFHDWGNVDMSKATQTFQITKDLAFTMMEEDDFLGKMPLKTRLAALAQKAPFFPLVDNIVELKSKEEGKQLLLDLNLNPTNAYNTYGSDDMNSDAIFSRIFFYGIGCVLIATQKVESSYEDLGPFVADMPLQDLEVRDGYRPYGARIHFDKDQKVTGIYDYHKKTLVKPGDAAWECTKFIAKSTALNLITVREHLVWSHLIGSNEGCKASIECLPPSHPIRRLLTVFTLRTNTVNYRAYYTLVGEYSVLHRLTGLTYDSLTKVLESSYEECSIFQPFPDLPITPAVQNLSNKGKFPYRSEGVSYYNIVYKFVVAWLVESGESALDHHARKFYEKVQSATKNHKYVLPDFESEDAMAKLLTQFIFIVTAYHEMIGTLTDYTTVQDGMATRCVDGKTESDAQSLLYGAFLSANTNLTVLPMLMQPFEKFFGQGGAPLWEIERWADFQEDLASQSALVQAADAKRDVEFKIFDPAKFECSISV